MSTPSPAPVTTSISPTRSMFLMPSLGDKNQVVLLVIVSVLLFVLVIVWIIFSIKNSNLKEKILIGQPIKMQTLTAPTTIADASLPTPKVGREYSYSFWIYLENFSQTAGASQPYKMVMYRGTDPTTVTFANPIVFMDPVQNKLYFVIKTQGSSIPLTDPLTGKVLDPLSRVVSSNYFMNDNLSLYITQPPPNTDIVLTVDYIPLQRWVNVVVAVDNKLLTTFVDGEIYSVKGTDEIKSSRAVEYNNNAPVTYNLLVDKTVGDVSVGPTPFNMTTIEGYVSNVAFYNYAVVVDDVRKVYNKGPFTTSFWTTLLKWIGLGSYGVRSPVYSLTSSTAADTSTNTCTS